MVNEVGRLNLPRVGFHVVGHLAFPALAQPSIDGTSIQLNACCLRSEGVHGHAQDQELGSETHVDQAIKRTVGRELEVVEKGQQQNGDGGERQCKGQVLAFLERGGLDGRDHAEVHGAHVGDEQPGEEPLGVKDGP